MLKKILVIAILAVVVIVFLISGNNTKLSQQVSFTTSDNVKIVGDFYRPPIEAENYPLIILVHQAIGSRHDWDPYIVRFLEKGYAVLAYDIRGHGQSNRTYVGGIEVPYENPPAYFDSSMRDMEAAVSWASKNKIVDSSRIAIVGSSMGANIAFVSAGNIDEIKTGVAISPRNTGNILMGQGVVGFSPHSLLILNSEAELKHALDIYNLTAEPREYIIYSGRGHGFELLSNSTIFPTIFDWLNRTL